MFPTKYRDRNRSIASLHKFLIPMVGLVVMTGMPIGMPSAHAAQPPRIGTSAKDPMATSNDAGEPTRRRDRRRGRRSDRRTAADTGQRLSQTESGRRTRARRHRRVKTAGIAQSHLDLSGSFELESANRSSVRGEGAITLNLDQADAENLRELVTHWTAKMPPVAKDTRRAIAALPAMLKSIEQILRALSDPETQRNLQQVEQLLRLFKDSAEAIPSFNGKP